MRKVLVHDPSGFLDGLQQMQTFYPQLRLSRSNGYLGFASPGRSCLIVLGGV